MTSYCVEFSGFDKADNNASMFALYAGSFSMNSKGKGAFTLMDQIDPQGWPYGCLREGQDE